MEIKQHLRMTQQLVMTPQLQQAIKLLQMSRLELESLVREEMLDNPMLEESMETGLSREDGRGSVTADTIAPEATTIDRQVSKDDQESRQKAAEGEKKAEEIDWERYLENHSLQQPMPSFRRGNEDELPSFEANLSVGEDLVDHLAFQIQMSNLVEDEQRFAALVLGNLDDAGYLKMDGVPAEEVVPKLAAEAELHPEDAEEVLYVIQGMEPLGVASRTLAECLRVQAEAAGLDPLTLKVIDEHLDDLERKNYNAVAKTLDVPVEEIYDVAQVIAELEPRPGRNYTTEEPRYIVPDVHVHRVGEEYFVVANDDGMPKLKISRFYRTAIHGDPKAKEYIQNKMRSAQWLIRSIDQRRKTIVKVTECIVEKQRDFFDKGIDFLKPMILRDVAEAVEMHESTISRVTSNKYVSTPRGVYELKFFFNSAIKRDNSEDIASESVKQAIKKIVSEEDSQSPFSDQKIVEILAQRNIRIARRTVAKYREMLGILSSSKRKRYF